MSLAEREARIKEWVARVHEAECRLWPDSQLGPLWRLAHWYNYVDANQLWPRTQSGKNYHRAFDLGIDASEMADIAWAMQLGDEYALLRAIESRVPASYMLVLNEAYQDRLTADGMQPGTYPAFFISRLYAANVPAEYAAALIRASAPIPTAIIKVYEQGISAEYALELDLEAIAVEEDMKPGGPLHTAAT